MLPGLGHRAVGRGNHQDSAVHLGRPGNHILDIVGMPGTVNMGVVAVLGLILHVRDINSNPSFPLFRGIVNGIIGPGLGITLFTQYHCNRRGKSGLAMVNMTDGSDINVRFGSDKLFFSHFFLLFLTRLTSA